MRHMHTVLTVLALFAILIDAPALALCCLLLVLIIGEQD
jgi:hypothetical protein